MRSQFDLDYANYAQARVCHDARLLFSSATLTIPAGSSFVTLPADLIRLTGIAADTIPVPVVNRDAAFRQATSGGDAIGPTGHYIIGRDLYVTPAPNQDLDLAITYISRPATMDSSSDLSVINEAEEAVKLRILADTLLDDGQDEMADLHEQLYSQAIRNLRRGRGGQAVRHQLGTPVAVTP